MHPRPGFLARTGAPFALLLACASFDARAQTYSPLAEWQFSAGQALIPYFESPMPVHSRMVGLPLQVTSRYEGSSHARIGTGVLAAIRWRDVAFASIAEGLGVNLLHGKGYRAGIAATYDLGRKEHVDPALAGLGNIPAAAEAKFFGEYVPVFPLVLRADLRRAFGGHGGWTGDLSAYMPVHGSSKFVLMAGPSLTWIDGDNMRRTFGITPAQAAASGYPVYTPDAGISALRLGVTAAWFFADHWFVDVSSAAEWLRGDAADSPIVRDKRQESVSTTLGYEW